MTVRKKIIGMSVLLASVAITGPAAAANSVTITRGDYTLDFRDPADAASKELATHFINTFFMVYPKMVADFNPNAPRRVTFVIKDTDGGVGETLNDVVTYYMGYFRSHQMDIDVVTHELMHVVQGYGDRNNEPVPSWLTEGIADYARAKYGVANAEAPWSLRGPGPDSSYTDGYQVTGAFLDWVERNRKPGIVKALDASARAGNYNDMMWTSLVGARLSDLWQQYTNQPPLTVTVKNPDALKDPATLAKVKAIIAQAQKEDVARKEALNQPVAGL